MDEENQKCDVVIETKTGKEYITSIPVEYFQSPETMPSWLVLNEVIYIEIMPDESGQPRPALIRGKNNFMGVTEIVVSRENIASIGRIDPDSNMARNLAASSGKKRIIPGSAAASMGLDLSKMK